MTGSGDSATTDNEAVTLRFTVGRTDFARAMMSRFGGKWWLLLTILILAGSAAGAVLSDWRWAVAGLMLALVVAPAGAAFLYFSYGLKSECYINVLPHTVNLSPDGILISADVMPRPDEVPEGSEPQPIRTYKTLFPTTSVGKYRVDSKGITIDIEAPSRGFLRLPYSAFESPEHFRMAVEILVDIIRNKHSDKNENTKRHS